MKGTFILTSLLIGIFFVTGALFITAVDGTQETSSTNQEITLNKTAQALAVVNEDTDKDGLSDWEERLWGSDPSLVDTDNDGTQDGEEVQQKRNPRVAGPNDTTLSTATASSSRTTANESPFAKNSFAESFAQTYIALNQGTKWSEQEKIDLAERLLAEIQGNDVLTTEKTVSLKQLTITDVNTTNSYSAYVSGLKTRLKENRPIEPENEALVLQRALETKNSQDFEKLESIALSHEKTADSLSNLPTPSGLAVAHLELINALYNISIAVQGMQRSQSDPIAGLAGIQRYAPAQQRLAAALLSLNIELKKNNVSL